MFSDSFLQCCDADAVCHDLFLFRFPWHSKSLFIEFLFASGVSFDDDLVSQADETSASGIEKDSPPAGRIPSWNLPGGSHADLG